MRTPVFVYAVPGETYALVRGPRVGRWFRDQGIPALRSPSNNGFWLRQERVPDVMARMELSGLSVNYSEHLAPRHVIQLADDMEATA